MSIEEKHIRFWKYWHTLPSLATFNEQITKLKNESPEACAEKLATFWETLKRNRIQDDGKSAYALPFVKNVSVNVREEFFSKLVLLMEHQSSDLCRMRLIALLLELSTIELAPPPSDDIDDNPEDSLPFGYHALKTLKDVMPSTVNLTQLYLRVLKDGNLDEVLQVHTPEHILILLPLHLDIIKQPHFDCELYRTLKNVLPILRNVYETVINEMKEDSNDSMMPDLRRVESYHKITEFFTICAEDPEIATYLYEIGVGYLLNQNLKKLEKIDIADDPSDPTSDGHLFSAFRLIGSLARRCSDAADYFSDRKNRGPGLSSLILSDHLLHIFVKGMPKRMDELESASHPYPAAVYANVLYCLANLTANSAEGLANVKREQFNAHQYFVNTVIELATNFVNVPIIMAAATDALYLIATAPLLKTYRVYMEQQKVGHLLTTLCEDLLKSNLPVSSPQREQMRRDALTSLLKLMTHYNDNRKISLQMNQPEEGKDREELLFDILSRQGNQDGLVGDDVRVAAAECLSSVNLDELDQAELRRLVNLFSTLPPVVPPKTYQAMTYIVYLMFNMALHGMDHTNDNSGDRDEKGDELNMEDEQDPCGKTFREVYSDEVVSLVYTNLDSTIQSDESPSHIEKYRNRFEVACTKFLMTAWVAQEFRNRDGDKTPVDILSKSLRSEASTLRWIKLEHESRIAAKECIVCGGPMIKTRTIRAGQRPPIRCDKCANNINELDSLAYFFLYLEQTWVGFNVMAMFRCLAELKYADMVAFRCMHQIANCVQGVTQDHCVSLLADLPFEEWNAATPAGSIFDIQLREQQELPIRPTFRTYEHNHMPLSIEVMDVSTMLERSVLFEQVCTLIVKSGNNLDHKVISAELKRMLQAVATDDRMTVVCLRHGRQSTQGDADYDPRRIVGFACGGPVKLDVSPATREQGHWPTPKDHWMHYYRKKDHYENLKAAEVYRVAVDKDFIRFHPMLLAQMSHECYQKGFEVAYAWVHKSERSLYNLATKWQNKSELRGKGDQKDEQGKGAFLYKWDLEQNEWVVIQTHQNFLDNRGILKLIGFLAPERKYESKTKKSPIRVQMEKFGAQLANQFHKTPKEVADNLSADRTIEMKKQLRVPSEFLQQLRLSFSAPEFEEQAVPDPVPPVWDAFILGTEEEMFVRNVSSCPSLTPNPDPDPDDDPIDDPNPDNTISLAEQTGSTETALAERDQISEREDTITKTQLDSICAAMLRTFVTILTESAHTFRKDALAVFRERVTFQRIFKTLKSFRFGLRRSILDDSLDNYGNCSKYCRLVEEVLGYTAVGPPESLYALDLYEVLVDSFVDMASNIHELINSRVENTRDPLHEHHRLLPQEERTLRTVLKMGARLVHHIGTITFFPGNSAKIAEGNSKCRSHAVQELCTVRRMMSEVLFTFILYDTQINALDLEKTSRPDYDEKDAKYIDSDYEPVHHQDRTRRPIPMTDRDVSRIYLSRMLGEYFRVDSTFKYNFLRRYSSALFLADISLRSTFVRDIQRICCDNIFRDKLTTTLSTHPDPLNAFYARDEYTIFHAFVETAISGGSNSSGVRLFVISNKRYYVSTSYFRETIVSNVHEWTSQEMTQFVSLEPREFRDVNGIYCDFNGQMFCIERYLKPADQRLRGQTLYKQSESFLERRMGITHELVTILSKQCRNDMNKPARVLYSWGRGRDENSLEKETSFLQMALEALCEQDGIDVPAGYKPFLWSHVWVRQGSSRVKKILIWMVAGGAYDNLDNSQGGGYLICTSYNQYGWKPACPQDDYKLEDRKRDAANFFWGAEAFELNSPDTGVLSIDFTEDAHPHMVLGFQTRSLYIAFACDTGREVWRREFKRYFFNLKDADGGSSQTWFGASIPDLRATSENNKYHL